jgi:hypothetical protein
VVREVAAEAPVQPSGGVPLARGDEDAGVRDVVQAVGVIVVQVREDDGPDAGGVDADALELRAELVLGRDLEAHAEAVVGMPTRQVARLVHARALAGVDHDRPIRMLDRPGEDRQPVRPLAVAQRVEPPSNPGRHRGDLAALDAHPPGLDRVDPQAAVRPPSMTRPVPVMKAAASEAR